MFNFFLFTVKKETNPDLHKIQSMCSTAWSVSDPEKPLMRLNSLYEDNFIIAIYDCFHMTYFQKVEFKQQFTSNKAR